MTQRSQYTKVFQGLYDQVKHLNYRWRRRKVANITIVLENISDVLVNIGQIDNKTITAFALSSDTQERSCSGNRAGFQVKIQAGRYDVKALSQDV